MPETLTLDFKRSRWSAGYLIALHTLATAGLLLSSLSNSLLVVLLLLLSGHFIFCYRKHYRLSTVTSVTAIKLAEEACWIQTAGHQGWQRTELGERHYVTRFLVIVQLRRIGKKGWFWLPVWRDSLQPEAFRRLRVRLRFPAGQKVRNSAALRSY